tara:strand:+ start:230 stop:574 length:345 start_codon:yes stop_codon:yes gene_type:complete
MDNLFTVTEGIMLGLVLFSALWIFLFNYRNDHKDKYKGHRGLIFLDLIINLGMSATGYILITLVFTNVPQLAAYETYRYPIGYLFGLTSNVSIPIVLKWFQEEITKKLSEVGKK